MKTYSDLYAKELIAAISELTGDMLAEFSSEIQDGGYFLLITASPKHDLVSADFDTIEKKVKGYLDVRIPKRDGDYAWMLTIIREGEIVGTVFSEMT